jgi:hypothetical protein
MPFAENQDMIKTVTRGVPITAFATRLERAARAAGILAYYLSSLRC